MYDNFLPWIPINFPRFCSRCGTLCFTSETFVAINDEQRVILYHLGLGCRWLLPRLEGVISVSSIHRNTGFVAGSSGKAQLIDIPLALVTQVLCEGSSTVHVPSVTYY